MSGSCLPPIEGRFFRAMRTDRIHLVLEPPRPMDCGRYHAAGQAALYMNPTAEWARVTVSGYTREGGLERVIFPLLVSGARVLDPRDEDARSRLRVDREQANASWRKALSVGERPPSWDVSDATRAAGGDGLIARSRLRPGAWHVTLFRWNMPGGPRVRRDGGADAVLIR